ncbi:Putative deoxyribonuclease RhsC [Streptococcus oralis]|uniref:Deoxyribonuclease RhsC n=1 Tax=Streptococcus oralis TaxID=1303 RepID=A0A6N3B3R6_STROR
MGVHYDALGRRIDKGRLKDGEVSDGLEEEIGFVWDGRYTYIYTDPDSYEPLAQVHNHTNTEGENHQQNHYFHCDQIGILRDMTDKDANLLWYSECTAWGRLKEETKVTDSAYQPFRLQNQYAVRETGLHYNFFRYYDPDAGRFVNQDPIKLKGGNNLYQFAPNVQGWVDIFGLYNAQKCASISARIENLKYEIYLKRIPALESNPNYLPWRIGPGEALRDTVRGHVKLLNAAYSKLAKAEKE